MRTAIFCSAPTVEASNPSQFHVVFTPLLPLSTLQIVHVNHLHNYVYKLQILQWAINVSTEYHVNLLLTHCGRVTQICVFNTVKFGTSASSP